MVEPLPFRATARLVDFMRQADEPELVSGLEALGAILRAQG